MYSTRNDSFRSVKHSLSLQIFLAIASNTKYRPRHSKHRDTSRKYQTVLQQRRDQWKSEISDYTTKHIAADIVKSEANVCQIWEDSSGEETKVAWQQTHAQFQKNLIRLP
jgi:hypothetical protein